MIAAYMAYIGESWGVFIFLIVGFLFIDYKNLNFLKEGIEEAKKAEGSYPKGKLKSYFKETSKQTTQVMSKGYDGDHGMKYETGKKLSKGTKNFFDEINDLFK
jgi:hypothetical protein